MIYAIVILLAMATVAESAPTIKRFGDSYAGSAVFVQNAMLGHTTQLYPEEGKTDIDSAISDVLSQLAEIIESGGSTKKDLVKLNLYAKNDESYSQIIQRLNEWCSKANRPAVTFVTTNLSREASFALDAVFVVHQKNDDNSVSHFDTSETQPAKLSILPQGDAVYVSGQAEPGDLATATRETLNSLLRTLKFMQLDRSDIVQVKCFLQPMEDVAIVDQEIKNFFAGLPIPAIVHVEWIAGSKRPIEIELIAAAPLTEADETVSYLTPPEMTSSPVYSRVARIHGNRRIYIGGLVANEDGSGAEQVHEIYQQLISRLKPAKSNLRHLAKATYYVSDADSSSQLNKIRPHYYDPERPPAASKLMVRGIGHAKRSISIDFVAAPESPPKSVLVPKAERLKPSRSEVYKSVGKRDLKLHLFESSGHQKTDRRPVFLAIHGGGWTGGHAQQFFPFAAHFAEQGMLGVSLEYRLRNTTTGTTVFDCVEDTVAAVHWIRKNAERIGADPDRIVVMGGSAGGHLAISTAVFEDTVESSESNEISAKPNAIIAMYPVIDTSRSGYGQAKIGERWQELSPVHNVRSDLPPMLIFHGTGDNVTPFPGAEQFHQKSVELGNDCKLIVKPAGRHGYIIFDETEFENALAEMERFISEKGKEE